MKWQPVTAIYIIGNRYPIATFLHENQAEEWAEANYPGEWVKKGIKIPNLPVTPKSATQKPKNLKDLAERLANLDWSVEEDEEGEGVSIPGKQEEEKQNLKDVAAQLAQMDWDAGEKDPEDEGGTGADGAAGDHAAFGSEFDDDPEDAAPAPAPAAAPADGAFGSEFDDTDDPPPAPVDAPRPLDMPEFIDDEAEFGSEFDDPPEEKPRPGADDLFV